MAQFEVKELLKSFQHCEDFWGPIYTRGAEDVSFALGEQWPQKIKKRRKNRPCLVENRMLPFVHQVINQIRQARPSIIPKPVDDGADVERAEILRGVIKNIEVVSDADTVYDTAARNSVMGSVGWIRVCTDYASPTSFDQEIKLERIQNFQSVFLDPNHERQDGSDARYGFIYSDMDKEEFKKKYPEAQAEGFTQSGWGNDKTVRIAEYFEKIYTTKELVEYSILTMRGEVRNVALSEKVPQGATILKRRETEVCSIRYAKLTGLDILEEGEFPGEYIPLVPVYGFETFTDGRREFFSLIHPAKDPQMMLNFLKSASTESLALQPKAPFVGPVGSFKTYQKQWAEANEENYATLEYDVVKTEEGIPVAPPQRQAPPSTSGTLMQEAALSADAIKAALGIYDASMGAQTADISGKAIISRQMQGDNATFHFVDNLSVAIRHVGRILVGLIPIIYTGPRIARIMKEDGSNQMVPLNQPVTKVGNEYQKAADPSVSQIISFDAGKYDVVVEVGASYATKRQELANAIVEIARVNPEIMNIAGDLFIKALDVPNAEDIANRIRATMNPALLGDDVEAKRLQEMTAALNQMQEKLALTEQALLAKEQNQEFKNELDKQKVENDTKKLMIEAAKAEAEIEKIKAEIGGLTGESLGAMAEVINSLQGQLSDVTGALDVLLSAKEDEATGAPEAPVNESLDNDR